MPTLVMRCQNKGQVRSRFIRQWIALTRPNEPVFDKAQFMSPRAEDVVEKLSERFQYRTIEDQRSSKTSGLIPFSF